MPSLEELQAWTKLRHAKSPEQIMERRVIHGVAVAMSELKGDPNWKLFCDHIEPLRQRAEDMAKKIEHDLINGPIVADVNHYEAKRQLAISRTRFETYNQVIALIDSLINRDKSLTA